MMVLPLSRGSRRTRLSNMQPWLPRLLMVPDWCMSKCGGREVMAYFITPPGLAFGSAALSWNFEPSNSLGTPWASACHGMPNTVAVAAAEPLTKSRRLTRERFDSRSCILAFLPIGLFVTEHCVL